MTINKFKEEVEYLKSVSLKTKLELQHIESAGELVFKHLVTVYKREGFTDVQDFIEWYADRV